MSDNLPSSIIAILVDTTKFHQLDPMVNWCVNNAGDGGWTSYNHKDEINDCGVSSIFGNSIFYFRNEQIASLFVLTWL